MKVFYNRGLWYVAEDAKHAHELCSSDFLANKTVFVPAASGWKEVEEEITISFPLSPTEPLLPENATSEIIVDANAVEVTANVQDWCNKYGYGLLGSCDF